MLIIFTSVDLLLRLSCISTLIIRWHVWCQKRCYTIIFRWFRGMHTGTVVHILLIFSGGWSIILHFLFIFHFGRRIIIIKYICWILWYTHSWFQFLLFWARTTLNVCWHRMSINLLTFIIFWVFSSSFKESH